MQSQNPFFDELAKMTTNAMSLAQAAGEEAKAAMRAQTDKFVAEMDLVRRDELDAVKAELAALRAEVAAMKTAPKPAPAAATAAKTAAPKAAAKPASKPATKTKTTKS